MIGASRARGYSLIELLLVLSLLVLMASLVPSSLLGLKSRGEHQALVQKTLNAFQDCSTRAQQQQQTLALGSDDCSLPTAITESIMAADQSFLPLFHPDGTASQSMKLIVETGKLESTIRLDRLTARVSIVDDFQQGSQAVSNRSVTR